MDAKARPVRPAVVALFRAETDLGQQPGQERLEQTLLLW